MKTLLIVGAGPRIGMSLARRFGREGYRIGVISRSQEKLNSYVSELASLSIESIAFAADVHDPPALLAAIEKIRSRFGPIDILEYSPLIKVATLVSVLKLDADLVKKELEFSILSAITAANAVVDDMIKNGDRALLFTLGTAAYMPGPSHASGALGVVAIKQYALNLYIALQPKGIYIGTLAIGQPFTPDEIGEIYWEKVQKRTSCETLYGDPRGKRTLSMSKDISRVSLHPIPARDSLRILAAYEIMAAQGLGQAYPPKLIGNIPEPRDEKERHTYLVGLFHAAECAVIVGETQEELTRYKNVAKSIGGDPDSHHYGGNIDMVFPAVVTI